MVNQDVQGVIPLEGRGFVSKPRGDFQPGEFKRLSNCELLDTKIVGRRNMKMPNYTEAGGEAKQRQGLRHIGFWQDWAIYTNDIDLLAYSTNGEVVKISDVTNLVEYSFTVGADTYTYDGFFNIVGFFTYNNYNYLLVFNTATRTDNVDADGYVSGSGYKIFRWLDQPSKSEPQPIIVDAMDSIVDDSWGGGTGVKPDAWIEALSWLVGTASEFEYFNSYFNGFFLYKERLFICTKNGLYFSKATDPTVFSVSEGEGGYFKLGNHEPLTCAVADYDRVYLFTDDETHIITYADDPNIDGQIIQVSDTIGAMHAVTNRSEVYFVNNEGIFTINNTNVEKVLDSDFDDGLNVSTRQRLASFGQYLVLNKTYEDTLDGTTEQSNNYDYRTNLIAGSSKKGNLNVTTAPNRTAGEAIYGDPVWKRSQANSTYTVVAAGAGIPPTNAEALEITRTVDIGDLAIESPLTSDSYSLKYPCVSGQVYSISAYLKQNSAAQTYITVSFYDESNTSLGSVRFESNGVFFPGTLGDFVLKAFNPFGAVGSMPIGTFHRFGFSFRFNSDTPVRMHIKVGTTALMSPGDKLTVGGVMLEQTDSVKAFIGDNLGVSYGHFHSASQFPYAPPFKAYTTTYFKGSLPFYSELYPYWYAPGADPNGNVSGFNTYFINMDTGSVHVLDYHAVYDDEFTYFISDVVTNGNYSDQTPNGDTLFFLNSDRYGAGNTDEPNHYVSYMNYELDSFVRDHCVEAGLRVKTDPAYLMEIDSYVPDGNEYLIKKYRNLSFMAKFPKERFELKTAYDNLEYGDGRDVNDDPALVPVGSVMRPHLPHRVGLNQRARSLSIQLGTVPGEPQDEDYDFFELSDIRVLWTYTGRDTTTDSYSGTT